MDRCRSSDVAVVIPTLNEEEGLGPTAREIMQFLDTPYILVVDGNSTDGTVEVARKFGLDVIFQRSEGGKGCALAEAMNCLKLEPRFVVFIDADFTYPAEYIPYMIRILEENPDVGMVCGDRFDKPFNVADVKSAYYVGNRFLAFAQYLVNGVKMRDPLTGLRVVRWEILKDWKPKSKGFDIEAEMNYAVERKGYKIREIPIHYRERLGEKKLKLKHGFTILRRILSESFT
ncbi:glycosyltransferase family 2 protein [Candidatus Bathyarchaeota archaeon]|nr:glycosyltransferase family 2 protein [Candidatus Bathyarchaeota archaeon]